MESMAELMKKLGWIAWVLTVIGWFLSPIISLLVNKIFVYLVFDTSKKLKELDNEIIRKLKQMLGVVEEQTVLRAAEDKGSQCDDLKSLDSMKMDLKSALYEAEDILDLRDYRRIEKCLHHGDDDSVWVEKQLAAACAWIAFCKESWFGRWIAFTLAAVMKGAQSMIRLGQFLIQALRHSRQNFDLFCIRRDRASVLQCAQSWYQQLGQLFMSVILPRSGVPLLPVSINPTGQPRSLESRGSEFVPADPACRPAEEMVDQEEIVEETQVEEGDGEEIQDGEEGALLEEIEEESSEGGEGEETSEEEIQGEGEETSSLLWSISLSDILTSKEEIQDGEEGGMLQDIEESSEGEEEGETSDEEIEEDDEEGEEGAMLEIEEESCEGEEEGETLEEEIEEVGEASEEETEEGCEGGGGETSAEDIHEDDEASEEETEEYDESRTPLAPFPPSPTSLSILLFCLRSKEILQYCARSMLTWFAKACFYRDWSYGIVGIKSDKKDASAVESLVPITKRISLKNRIKRLEDILNTSKKSDLLNYKNSNRSTPKDGDKESSSSSTVKNSSEESTSTQKEIDDEYRSIEKKVFGRDKGLTDMIRMLRKEPDTYAASSSTSKPYSVIGIYGITGSGKSTLAQYVCDNEKSAGHFNLIMFVLVGKTFSICDIFREMLHQIKQQRPTTELKGLKSLRAELEKELKGKCFLLVLDDLWVSGDNMKERGILLDVLDAGQSGSRILVTAQKKDAAAALGAQEKMQIPIPDLDEEQYLSMFMHYALEVSQVNSTDYERYEVIGRKITKKLRRSPIAAITVAARLKSNNSIDFWETTAHLDVLDETMGALWWSYQQLGVDIRRCFAYCSTFPRGYDLQRDELVRIWIAQGFVNTRSNATEELEDVGQHYFHQLLTFSFLQARQETYFGSKCGPVRITIHDLLQELVERVSESEFFRIGLNNGSPKDIPLGVCHLFIETYNVAEIIEKMLDMGNLRTLIITDRSQVPMDAVKRVRDMEKALGRLFMRLTKLRVLIIDLRNYHVKEWSVPACIDHMKHLRYLGYHTHGRLLILPSTFSKLYHIQTIDIPHFDEVSCPKDMGNLIYLRHISGPASVPNIGTMESLQKLRSFIVRNRQGYGLKQLKHLNKLRGYLIICCLGIVRSKEEALEAHLAHKELLSKLDLRFKCDWYERVGPNVEAEVLEGLCPPMHLKELSMENYRGSEYPSWMLSHHPDAPKQLHRLSLYDCSQLASTPKDSKLFIGLRELCIDDCKWDRLPENMECLVLLQYLEIGNCHKLQLLPTLPRESLKTISICSCGVLSTTCKEEGHDNWLKIQHIPKKVIF